MPYPDNMNWDAYDRLWGEVQLEDEWTPMGHRYAQLDEMSRKLDILELAYDAGLKMPPLEAALRAVEQCKGDS